MSGNHKKLNKFTKDEMEMLLHGKDKKFKAKFDDHSISLTKIAARVGAVHVKGPSRWNLPLYRAANTL